jgi:hypothetical protein
VFRPDSGFGFQVLVLRKLFRLPDSGFGFQASGFGLQAHPNIFMFFNLRSIGSGP